MADAACGGGEADEDEEERKERQHFAGILRAYDNYAPWALAKVARLEADYARLSPQQERLLDTASRVAAMRTAIHANAAVLDMVAGAHRDHIGAVEDAAHGGPVLVNRPGGVGTQLLPPSRAAGYVPESDMDKLQSTLKQFVREWSAEGHAEREAAHRPLLEALERALPTADRGRLRVLVPGAGLGRLAWEVANAGYTAQASEFSYHMLLAANFILNSLERHGTVTVHPWVLQTCNVRQREDLTRGCVVPDVAPWSLPAHANLSMCAGDFLEVYRDQFSCWESVLTCFFIDTAHNVCEYIRRISELLTPGGAWINMGPLLWHFSDMANEVSVELTWDELRRLIVGAGFIIEHEDWHTCPYVRNVRSMYRMEYDCVCFVARWPGQHAQ
jgi:carnosine N-methyltransferase